MTAFTKSIPGLIGWLAICFVAAGAGAVASIDAASFYASLVRPAWAPPAWVFGPAWSTLYLLMGIAAWLVWRTPASPQRTLAIRLFLFQLAVNALWSWLFFAWHMGTLAQANIVLLLVLIAMTMHAFQRLHKPAAWLLAPYLLWVGFATALSWTIWQANPGMLR